MMPSRLVLVRGCPQGGIMIGSSSRSISLYFSNMIKSTSVFRIGLTPHCWQYIALGQGSPQMVGHLWPHARFFEQRFEQGRCAQGAEHGAEHLVCSQPLSHVCSAHGAHGSLHSFGHAE